MCSPIEIRKLNQAWCGLLTHMLFYSCVSPFESKPVIPCTPLTLTSFTGFKVTQATFTSPPASLDLPLSGVQSHEITSATSYSLPCNQLTK